MKNKYKSTSLIGLYISYLFQKATLIIMGISLVAMIVFLVIISNPWIDNTSYLLSSNDIHRGYLEQGIFVIQVFNSIILATIVIQLFINSSSFDALFISYISRKRICILKLVSVLIIISILILFEVLVLYFIPTFRYSLYKPNMIDLASILYLFIGALFEVSFSILISSIVQSIFIPMGILFVSIILKAISSIEKLKNALSYFVPLVYIKDMKAYLGIHTIIISSMLVLVFLILYLNIYDRKDIKC